MTKQRKKTVSRKKTIRNKKPLQNPAVAREDLDRLEFFRNAAALMPDPKDKHPGIAVLVETLKGSVGQLFCSCNTRRPQTCSHLKELPRILSAYRQQIEADTPADDFRASFWYRFAETMADGSSAKADTVRLAAAAQGSEQALAIVNASGERLLTYYSQGLDRSRFLERCTVAGDEQQIPTRGHVISQLSLLTLTEDECMLWDHGFKTRRQILEKFKEPVKTVINRSRVPAFLEEFKMDLADDAYRIDDTVKRLKIIRDIKRIEITPELLERDWCWLSARYGVGSQWISLADILAAKIENQRYVATDEGWIDVESPTFNLLDTLVDRISKTSQRDGKAGIRLSRMDVLRLTAGGDDDIAFSGDSGRVSVLKRLCRTQPSVRLPELAGMTSRLRDYQNRGAEWLMFLFENGFGGLLYDDMGLGKTHQAMALIVWLRERKAASEPFLIVCPTTVISHWLRPAAAQGNGFKGTA